MDIISFVKSFPIRTFSKGEVLLSANEAVSDILIIREGIVKASSFNNAGEERLLWLAGRYDVVPTEGIFSRSAATRYFYTAYCNGTAYTVNKKMFFENALHDADIMAQVARGLSEHHDDLLSRLNSIEQPDLRLKILFMLHSVCEKFSGADVVHLHEIDLNLTHQDIADMVHATREAVSITLKLLQDEGFISYSRSTFTVFSKKIGHEINVPA